MKNIIKELYFGNIEPQARSFDLFKSKCQFCQAVSNL